MKPELEGTGGGFGRYRGFTVAETENLFRKAAEEGNMRSLSAVLRIAHEQLDARGGLGQTRGLAILFGLSSVVLFVVIQFLEGPARTNAERFAWGTTTAFIATFVGWVNTRRAMRLAIAQEDAIRNLAVDFLLQIVRQPSFKPKPLHHDQERLLRDLMRRTKRNESELVALLDA